MTDFCSVAPVLDGNKKCVYIICDSRRRSTPYGVDRTTASMIAQHHKTHVIHLRHPFYAAGIVCRGLNMNLLL